MCILVEYIFLFFFNIIFACNLFRKFSFCLFQKLFPHSALHILLIIFLHVFTCYLVIFLIIRAYDFSHLFRFYLVKLVILFRVHTFKSCFTKFLIQGWYLHLVFFNTAFPKLIVAEFMLLHIWEIFFCPNHCLTFSKYRADPGGLAGLGRCTGNLRLRSERHVWVQRERQPLIIWGSTFFCQ